MAHRLAVMNDGALQQVAPPAEIYAHPANLFVARFIGSPPDRTRFEVGKPQRVGGEMVVDTPSGQVPLPPTPSGRPSVESGAASEFAVGIRPERISFGDLSGPLAEGRLPWSSHSVPSTMSSAGSTKARRRSSASGPTRSRSRGRARGSIYALGAGASPPLRRRHGTIGIGS